MYKEPLLLFRNNGQAFENVSASGGPAFAQNLAGRGLAIGDSITTALSMRSSPSMVAGPLLLRNVAATSNHWLGVRLAGKKANPDAVGARIVWQAGDLRRSCLNPKVTGGSISLRAIRSKCWALAQEKRLTNWRFTGRCQASASTLSPNSSSTATLPSSRLRHPLPRVRHQTRRMPEITLDRDYCHRFLWGSAPGIFAVKRETATSNLSFPTSNI